MYDMKALYEAHSVREAITLLTDHPDARILAGGSDILVALRDGKHLGQEWVSIQRIDEMRRITMDEEGTLRIGALCSSSNITANDLVRRYAPSLGEAVATIGGPQVRNIATIGGNICNGVPSADSAATCFAWDAVMELEGPDGTRHVPIGEFYIRTKQVDIRPGEVVTAILITKDAYEGYKGAYFKYAMRNAMDIATCTCSTTVKMSADRETVENARIAFGVAGPIPCRAPHGEAAIRGKEPTKEAVLAAARAAIQDTNSRDSWRASKAFREHMLQEMARRCLIRSIKRAGGHLHD